MRNIHPFYDPGMRTGQSLQRFSAILNKSGIDLYDKRSGSISQNGEEIYEKKSIFSQMTQSGKWYFFRQRKLLKSGRNRQGTGQWRTARL